MNLKLTWIQVNYLLPFSEAAPAITEGTPMQKTLTKHGNRYALVIDKPILELLRVTHDTPFEIMSDGQCLVLTPVRDAKEERKSQKALEESHARFGRAMKKLAERVQRAAPVFLGIDRVLVQRVDRAPGLHLAGGFDRRRDAWG